MPTDTMDLATAVTYGPFIQAAEAQYSSNPNQVSPATITNMPAGYTPMTLLLGHLPGVKQVELDSPGDFGRAGLSGLAGGEIAGLLGLARAGAIRAVADEEAGHDDLQQEGGYGEVQLVRGGKPRPWRQRRAGRAGS